jgi:hypothetical protein
MIRFDLRAWSLFCVGLGLLFGLLLGCNADSSSLGTVAVSGTVTLKGSPVEGAAVTFVPTGTGGQSATGLTDSAGKYALTTLTSGDGAVPGQYKVIVTKFEGAKDAGGGAAAATPDGDMPASYGGAAPDAPPAKNLLPAKYASADSSGLTAEVKSGSPNSHNFALEE